MRKVAVAASGGRDSTALLHCTVKAARALDVQVLALHVHHGLMPAADDWLAHVRRQSARWGAGFAATRLTGRPAAGDSIEAWARRQRYAALAAMAHQAGCTLVLLAHHRRDQAETWLLQALRAGGPAGLSAMPRSTVRRGITWARPWLDMPRDAIDAYVKAHRLRHVEDASNADPRHARSRLRLQVWPALVTAFGDAEVALAGAAARAQEAAALAAEVAALDLPPLLDGEGLAVTPWRELPGARRRNALSAWLAGALQAGAPQSLVERLMQELPALRVGQWPARGMELRLYGGRLAVAKAGEAGNAGNEADGRFPADAASDQRDPVALDLSRPGSTALPAWAGRFMVREQLEGGAAPNALQALVPRARAGPERFCLSPNGTPRSLKKQYQASAIPAWQRSGPLLYTQDGRLLFVPGLGICAACQAPRGQPQLHITWQPDAPPGPGRAAPRG